MAKALQDMIGHFQNFDSISAKMVTWQDSQRLPSLIRVAADLRPKVIVLALAGDVPSRAEYEAVKYASDRDILVLAAAGNQGRADPEYPAGYKLKCLLSVSTALSHGETWGEGKTQGPSRGEIYLPQYASEGGTSFSTARAAAYAIAYFRVNPTSSCQMAKRWMTSQFSSTHTDLKLVQDVRSKRQTSH